MHTRPSHESGASAQNLDVTISSGAEGCAGGTTTELRATDDALAAWFGGFVAAEGSFIKSVLPSEARFRFIVALGASDAGVCHLLKEFFGVGRLYSYDRRQSHFDDEVQFAVQAMKDLVHVIVPFMDSYLPESHKRQQFLSWRMDLLDYWETRARRVRPCTTPGCAAAIRAHGLCRRHLYQAGLG